MEIETHDSIPRNILVKATFQLGTESYTIDESKGNNLYEQLVSMKEKSMKILKEFITKHNVPDEVPDEVIETFSDEEGDEEPPVKSKKTKT